MDNKLKIIIEINQESLIHALEEIEIHTDEGTSALPFLASEKWCEFQNALRNGYEKAISSDNKSAETSCYVSFDYNKFNDIATKIVLGALFEYANPVDLFNTTAKEITGRRDKALYNYQHDPMTNARVKSIVARLSSNINKCLGT